MEMFLLMTCLTHNRFNHVRSLFPERDSLCGEGQTIVRQEMPSLEPLISGKRHDNTMMVAAALSYLGEEALHGTVLSLQSFWHHSQLSSFSSLCILPFIMIVPRVHKPRSVADFKERAEFVGYLKKVH